ncbi:AAA family ATPase [Kitasatospora mediocidica]|uniref:AAA family ATPase n=1 Tax=Kitasatospora mediocidica TaxID=58352 RepID=UPI00056BEDB6|nr:SMC family ATPase [Kitasatospora mediocidica]
MKVNRLAFQNLRSYTDECTIDFTGKRLVAVLGNTGAGKTSLLEAVIFALYGRTSWGAAGYELISNGCEEMTVTVEFTVDGVAWRARRAIFANRKDPQAVLEPVVPGTAATVDNTRAVTRAITQIIGLDCEGFVSTVMLRQGRFNTLLKATPADRTLILRNIFGITELERVRKHILTRIDRLNGSILTAHKARKGLLDDPRASAARAERDLERTLGTARQRRERLDRLRGAQIRAVECAHRRSALEKAARSLRERRVADAGATMAALTQVKEGLDGEELVLKGTEADLVLQLAASQAALDAGALEDVTVRSLSAALAVLSPLPDRVTDLSTRAKRLEQEQLQHREQEQDDAAAAQELAQGEERAVLLRAATEQDERAVAEMRADADRVRDGLRAALQEASTAAGHRQSEHAMLGQAEDLRARSASQQEELAGLRSSYDAAQDALVVLQRSEAAHTAGAHLAPGDACPVCVRPLGEGFIAPEPSDGPALGRAKRAVSKHMAALNKGTIAHAESGSRLNTTVEAAETHRRQYLAADERMEAALLEVQGWVEAVRAGADPAGGATLDTMRRDVSAQARELGRGTPQTPSQIAAAVVSMVQPLREAEMDCAAALKASQAECVAAQTANEAARADLKQRRSRLQLERKRLDKARLQSESDRQALLAEIAAIPSPVRPVQIGPDELPRLEDIACAQDVAAQRLARLEATAREHEETRDAMSANAQDRQALAGRRQRTVDTPTRKLVGQLARWADTAADAHSLLGHPAALELPPVPDGSDLDLVDTFVAALASLGQGLTVEVKEAARQALAEVRAFEEEFVREAGAEATEADPDPGFPVPVDGELLAPAALDPLSRKTSDAEAAHERTKADLRRARSQIPYADALTAALEAADQQVDVWKAVSDQLTDGRFLAYLTDRRTALLLSHGSRILHTLSAQTYRFTAEFNVVDVNTNLERRSGTLSGGESFQTSLALALAFVELHSSTHKLESLFLDEGFGSLDSVRLNDTLQVLRKSATGDRSVTVISHLFPVAEAVNDVLMVRRKTPGSSSVARWLLPEERDNLIRNEIRQMLEHA